MTRVPRDVIFLLEAKGRWVVMNVFAHTCLGVGSEVLDGPGDVAVPTSNVNIPEFDTLY